jgi:hypothetical protein
MKRTYEHFDGKSISENTDHIEVKGHIGTWYVVGSTNHHGEKLFLLEHEEYGDEAACLIVTKTGHVKLEDVWNGLEELDY